MAKGKLSTLPNRARVGPSPPDLLTVLPPISAAASEDRLELGPARTPNIGQSSPIETVSDSQDRMQLCKTESPVDYGERNVFEAVNSKDGGKSITNKLGDYWSRGCGVHAQPSNPNKAQVSVSRLSGGLGVWPSTLHSMCVKLAVYVGTTEYILGPRMAWHYGGFMFYFVVIFLILISSFPANVLESLAGQFSEKSVVVLLPQLGPVFRGLGYAMLFVTGLVLVYYAIHVANVLMYAYHAAQAHPPWHNCSSDYNSKYCFMEKLQQRCDEKWNHTVYYAYECIPAMTYCRQNGFADSNGTHCFKGTANLTSRWILDLEEHQQQLLDKLIKSNISGIHSVGERYIATRDFHYHYIHGEYDCETNHSLPVCANHARAFALAYCTVWILALLPCFDLWVASTFAVVVIVASPLVILLVMTRVILFTGTWAGVANFFFGRASLRQILSSSFWLDAFGTTFWSIVVGTGVVPTLSSRDRLRHSALRSSVILVSADVAFGMLNSVLLFAVRGHLELDSGFSQDQLRQLDHDSEALVFVAFTTITDGMPRPRFWGSLYFGTMAAQSLATLTVFIVATALNLVDAVPTFRYRSFSLAVLMAGSPFLLAAGGLVVSILNHVHWSLSSLVRIQLAFVQLMFVVVLGFKLSKPTFRDQVQLQTGIDLRGIWRWMVGCWLIVCPLILLAELLGQLAVYSPPPIPPGGVPTAAFTYTVMACPVLVLIAGALYSARTTPFWELCDTSKEFGMREQPQQRRPASRASGIRGKKPRQGEAGVARSPTREGSPSAAAARM